MSMATFIMTLLSIPVSSRDGRIILVRADWLLLAGLVIIFEWKPRLQQREPRRGGFKQRCFTS
jgi:hypothetical protein